MFLVAEEALGLKANVSRVVRKVLGLYREGQQGPVEERDYQSNAQFQDLCRTINPIYFD
jgi:hypothetical protein